MAFARLRHQRGSDTEVTLPHEPAAELDRRRWRYLVAEDEVLHHLRDTGQAVPEA